MSAISLGVANRCRISQKTKGFEFSMSIIVHCRRQSTSSRSPTARTHIESIAEDVKRKSDFEKSRDSPQRIDTMVADGSVDITLGRDTNATVAMSTQGREQRRLDRGRAFGFARSTFQSVLGRNGKPRGLTDLCIVVVPDTFFNMKGLFLAASLEGQTN